MFQHEDWMWGSIEAIKENVEGNPMVQTKSLSLCGCAWSGGSVVTEEPRRHYLKVKRDVSGVDI